MHRKLARSFFILLCGALATGLGVLGALLFTPPGRSLLARLLSDQAPRLLRGSVHVGALRGGWFSGFTLDSVVIRDTAGVLLLAAPRIEVRYQLPNLFAGRIVVSSARVFSPEILIHKHRGGRSNLEEILRLGEKPPGGRPPLVELRELEIVDGRVTIRLPWNPDGRLRTAAQRDSALAAERSKPGRRIVPGPEGLELVRTVEGLNSYFPRLLVASPDRQPITIEIARLAARVSDPRLDIRDLRGQVRTRGDSLLFELERFELPGTEGRGSGRVDWPSDTLLFRFNLQAPRLALADLRFISPFFPDFTGSGRVRANSLRGTRTEYDIRDLVVADANSRVTGRMVAITDSYRGLGFRGLDVNLNNLDLDVVRPYLDTLPFHGTVTGPLRADGFFDAMSVELDWLFQDRAANGALNQVALSGPLRLGGPEGMLFEGARVARADLDLRTVRVISPAVTLEGRLALEGTLTGPLQNVVFQGSVEHRDSTRPASRLSGTVRLDTRGAVLGLETDVVLDSLVFEGIRRSFPALEARGALGGTLKLSGFLDRLTVDAAVGGGLGSVVAQGRVGLLPDRFTADSLRLRFQRLDLATLLGTGPRTSLQGVLDASGSLGSAVAPLGRLELLLGAGSVREQLLDSVVVRVSARDSLITLDTARVHWRGGRIDGGGTLGWRAPKSGTLRFQAEASALEGLDSLVFGLTGMRPNLPAGDFTLQGRARADVALQGALGALRIEVAAEVDSARWLAFRAKGVGGRLVWQQQERGIQAELAADSLWRRQLLFTGFAGALDGRTDSLRWQLSGSTRDLSRLEAGGRFQRLDGFRLFRADSLDLVLLGRQWELARPLEARISDSLIVLDTVRLTTGDGSGSVELAGALPRRGAGELAVTALGVELRDVYSLLQRDTAGIGGVLALDARLRGTASAPELRGSATLTGPVFGDFQAPLIRAAFDYRARQLQGNLTFWRTGRPVVEANLTVPLDLALTRVERRQLPGALDIVIRGDSIDLALAEAFTPNLRRVGGLLNVDATVRGSWETPQLAGRVLILEGAATVPGLGVRYQGINGTLRLAQDSILTEGVTLNSHEGGSLVLRGGLRLDRLTRPIFDVSASAINFDFIEVPNYMSVHGSGELRLTGSIPHPLLTGRGRVVNSDIYFADLIQKDIVNLEDPLFRDLVDTLALRKFALGASFQSRFLDSLTIRDLQLEIGEDVWLRSAEANFQLEGRLLVNKSPFRSNSIPMYRIAGTLDVPRGTYVLKAGGVINRTFTVEGGTVRYFGDLNAELDVAARYTVRSPQAAGEEVPIIARIKGTLVEPELTLETPPDRPPLSQPELISLLILGTSDPLALQTGTRAQGALAATAIATGALSSELQRALISDIGLPVDMVELRPGLATTGVIGGATGAPTQFAVGKALTSRLFVTANAGFCLGSNEAFSPQNLGATLEYRIRRTLTAQLAAEPVQTCLPRGVDIFGTAKRYQFGAELRWSRDY